MSDAIELDESAQSSLQRAPGRAVFAIPALVAALVFCVEAAVRLALFGSEAVLFPWRFTNHFPMAAGLLEIEEFDFRLRPNLDLYYKGAPFSTNEHGFRGASVGVDAPPDVFRIAVLGRSNTMGHGVADADVWTVALERRLDAWARSDAARGAASRGAAVRSAAARSADVGASLPGDGTRRFEVMNLGVSGHNLPAMIRAYERWWAKFEPDAVLIEAYATDLEPKDRLTLSPDATLVSVSHLLDYSFLAVVARRVAVETGLGRFGGVPVTRGATRSRSQRPRPEVDDSGAMLDAFVERRAAEGVPVILVRLARPSRLARGFGAGADTLVMREWEEAHPGAAWLDTAPWVEGRATRADRIFYGDDHPNPRVHELYAEALEALLLRELFGHRIDDVRQAATRAIAEDSLRENAGRGPRGRLGAAAGLDLPASSAGGR